MVEPKEVLNVANLTWKQLMQLDACTRCGECLVWCPVYPHDSREEITPRGKLRVFRRIIAAQNSLRRKWFAPDSWLGKLICPRLPTEAEIMNAALALYECSTCRQCHFVCPSVIDTVELYEALRMAMVSSGIRQMESHLPMIASAKAYDNPWNQPRSQRARWTRVAQREGRIKKIPEIIKPPKR